MLIPPFSGGVQGGVTNQFVPHLPRPGVPHLPAPFRSGQGHLHGDQCVLLRCTSAHCASRRLDALRAETQTQTQTDTDTNTDTDTETEEDKDKDEDTGINTDTDA